MTPKRLFETFKKEFPWFVPNVIQYKTNHTDGGIDIYMVDHTILNFQISRTGWTLKRGE